MSYLPNNLKRTEKHLKYFNCFFLPKITSIFDMNLFFQILEILYRKNSFTKNFNKPQNILICFFFVIFFFYRKNKNSSSGFDGKPQIASHNTRQTYRRTHLTWHGDQMGTCGLWDDLSKEVLNEKYNNKKYLGFFFAISISKWSSNKKIYNGPKLQYFVWGEHMPFPAYIHYYVCQRMTADGDVDVDVKFGVGVVGHLIKKNHLLSIWHLFMRRQRYFTLETS